MVQQSVLQQLQLIRYMGSVSRVLRKPGSIGKAIPEVQMKIVDQDGNEMSTDEIGEIVVRGENVMKGYFKMPKETAESFFEEWYRTGDMGYVDDEDYFYIIDRKKDMIIVNGMNVYPRMIEEVIYQHVAVLCRNRTIYMERCRGR